MPFFSRWKQPAQQQGRRLPAERSEWTLFARLARVSIIFAEVTQQIHSLRARGVKPFHVLRVDGWESRSFFKSAGIL